MAGVVGVAAAARLLAARKCSGAGAPQAPRRPARAHGACNAHRNRSLRKLRAPTNQSRPGPDREPKACARGAQDDIQ